MNDDQKRRTASIYPTADEINALPEKVRRCIHNLETRSDKSGEVQTMALLREDRDALAREVEELRAQIELLTQPKRIE
jgi:prefoldin subunit 5